MCKRLFFPLVVVLGVLLMDQVSKFLVIQHLMVGEPYRLVSGLDFNLTYNNGAAFGMFQRAGGMQRYIFMGIAMAVSLILIVALIKCSVEKSGQSFALAMILGGALGNLSDRIIFGYVNDFIDFHIRTWHFAIFNVADAAITVGVVVLLITMFLDRIGRSMRGEE